MNEPTISISDAEEMARTLALNKDILNQLNTLNPGVGTLLCAFYMGGLASQLPLSVSAFIEGMNYFKMAYEKLLSTPELVAERATNPDELIFIIPGDDSVDFGNANDASNVVIGKGPREVQ